MQYHGERDDPPVLWVLLLLAIAMGALGILLAGCAARTVYAPAPIPYTQEVPPCDTGG